MSSFLFGATARGAYALRRSLTFALVAVLGGGCEPLTERGADANIAAPPDARATHDAAVLAQEAGAAADAPSGPRADAAVPSPDAGGAPHVDAGSSDAGSVAQLDGAGADTAPLADAASAEAAAAAPERTADFTVGTRRVELRDDAGRVLPVQLWYPAVDTAASEASAGHGVAEFEAPGSRRELLEKLLAEAPDQCPNATMHAAIDAEPYPRRAPFPVLVYSHHFDGTRFSTFTIAESLARAGMVVAAPDHVGASLFERKDTLTSALDQIAGGFPTERVEQLRRVLDVMLDPQAQALPDGLRGRMDPTRVGALGHSMGGMAVGNYSVADVRVRASAYLAVVPSPALLRLLMDLPAPERFRTPALYLTAAEDTVVAGQGGPQELAANFESQPPPAYWIDVADAGHFSFADDSGLIADFAEGCAGMGQRIANGEPFTYLDLERAREIAAHYVTKFFAAELLGASRAPLGEARPPELVTIKQHGH